MGQPLAFAKSAPTLIEAFSGYHEVRKRSVPIDDSMSILLATAVLNNSGNGNLNKPLSPTAIYRNAVEKYARQIGLAVDVRGFCVHSLCATAATNALLNGANIAKVQEWLGHTNISQHTSVRFKTPWKALSNEAMLS